MNNPRPESLLDAIREPAALLDSAGRVVAANRRFTGLDVEQALAGPQFSPGTDYLQACARVRGDDEQSAAVTRGVRDVLAGTSPSFTLEYDCHRVSPPRSFELVANAYDGGAGTGALIVHYEITECLELEAMRADADRLKLVSDLMPDGFWDWNVETGEVYYSPRWCESLGYRHDELAPNFDSWANLIHPDDMPRVQEALKAHMEKRTRIYQCEDRMRLKNGSYRWSLDQGMVVAWDADGKPTRMVGIDVNIHDRKVAELTIRDQAKKLMEMSTPLIPISDQVVVMPLIGTIDATRAQQVLTTLLEGLSQRRAGVAILDITGVSEIDTHVASVLVNAAKAVQLLGARVVLTGVRPEVAQILVGLDIDWGNIIMRGTLQSGIAYATGPGR